MTMPRRFAEVLLDEADVGQHQVDARQFRRREGDAAIDDDPFAAHRPGRSRRGRSSCRSRRRRPAARRPVRSPFFRSRGQLLFSARTFKRWLLRKKVTVPAAHAAPADATAPKCTSPAAIVIISPPARADHETAVLVDRLEHAAHHLAVDLHRDLGSPARRRAPASAGGSRASPRPSSQSRAFVAPGIGQREEQRLGIARRRRVLQATSRDKASPSGCATTLTPMPIASA